MNTRKALFVSKLALILVLGYVVIRAVLPHGGIDNGLAPASAQGKGSAQAIESTRLPDLPLDGNPVVFGVTGALRERVSTDDRFGLAGDA